MKLKYKFVTRKIGEEYVSVPVGKAADSVHGMLRLNKTGAEILEMLGKETTSEKIAEKLADMYQRDQQEMLAYVQEFVGKLEGQGLIQ